MLSDCLKCFQILNDGDMALMDMGAEYHFYGSDITCSYPVSTSKIGHLSVPNFSVYYLDLFVPFSLLKESTPLHCVLCYKLFFMCHQLQDVVFIIRSMVGHRGHLPCFFTWS